MSAIRSRLAKFIAWKDGPTAVEKHVMLALVVIVCLTAIRMIGAIARTTFNVAGQLGS